MSKRHTTTIVFESEILYLATEKVFVALTSADEVCVPLRVPTLGTSNIRGVQVGDVTLLNAPDMNNYEKMFLVLKHGKKREILIAGRGVNLCAILPPHEISNLEQAGLAWLPGILHNMKYAPFEGMGAEGSSEYQYNAELVAALLEATVPDISALSRDAREAINTLVGIAHGTLCEGDALPKRYYDSVRCLEGYFSNNRRMMTDDRT